MAPTPVDGGLNRLKRHYRRGISGGEGVHVGQDEVACAVGAELGFVFPLNDGKGAQDILCVIPIDPIEVKVERVEACAQVEALLFIPDEGRDVLAEIAGESRHVEVIGVAEAHTRARIMSNAPSTRGNIVYATM